MFAIITPLGLIEWEKILEASLNAFIYDVKIFTCAKPSNCELNEMKTKWE